MDENFSTKGKRLRWARAKRYKSARAAALDMNISVSTYNSHERAGEPGAREYDEQDAVTYGRKFRVAPSWLLTGEGTARRTMVLDIVGLVGLGDTIQWAEGGHVSLGELELPYALQEGCFALEARGNSQWPRVQDGEVVVARWVDERPDRFVGREMIVCTDEGQYMLKTIKRHDGEGKFTIGSHNAPDQSDVKVERVAEVISIVPSSQWARIR